MTDVHFKFGSSLHPLHKCTVSSQIKDKIQNSQKFNFVITNNLLRKVVGIVCEAACRIEENETN